MPLAPVKNRSKTARVRRVRQIRNVAIAAVVLTVTVAGLIILFVWLSKPKKAETAAPSSAPAAQQPMVQARKPPANVQIGSSIQMISSPVAPGGNAMLTLRTTERAICAIKVVHLDAQLRELTHVTDAGLAEKIADEFGMVNWSWTMPADAAIAKWQADITCKRDEKTTRSIGEIDVKR